MATRRNRIKGIANIPQRRKVDNKPNEDPPAFLEPESISAETTLTDNEVVTISKSVLNEPSFEATSKLVVENNLQQDTTSDNAEIVPINDKPSNTTNTELPRRRTFIKPVVNPKLLTQKSKLKLEPAFHVDAKTEKANSSVINTDILAENSENLINQQCESLPVSHQTPPIKHIPIVPTESVKSTSDSEYPVGPLSPTKLINRSRIKAVPRLGQRRTSMTLHGSASESEDDGRKIYKRIRTESACSTASVTNEPQTRTDTASPQKSKEFSSVIQRKCKRTEQSRKMAEARRHFLHKFGNQTPDKQKLTMIDLIFYNPTANPMCQKSKKQPNEGIDDDGEHLESIEKKEDIKQLDDASMESDEENAIPAPQIKIGANGEIIVDEKSLTIENIETKRGREELQKSKIIDGDFDTGYGIYKREKRSKDWSKEETLRFYKALNTLGPDFSLMVELFAGRSRRELKMKFKKEERVNRLLIDKALTQPVQFDITELRKEVEEDQKRMEEEAERRSNLKTSLTRKHIPYYAQRKKVVSREKQNKKEPIEPKTQDMYSKLEKGIACVWESDTEEEGISEMSSTKPNAELKPTRSGRIPKPRQLYTPKDLTLAKKKRVPDSDQDSTFKDLNALQPGSIMIVSSQTPSGEPTFKVFMVTPTQNKIPITLTPDMLTNLTQSTKDSNAAAVRDIPDPNVNVPLEENNVTIPAEENVAVSTEAMEQEMCPYELTNISVPDGNNVTLPEDDKTVTFCSDGKYNIRMSME